MLRTTILTIVMIPFLTVGGLALADSLENFGPTVQEGDQAIQQPAAQDELKLEDNFLLLELKALSSDGTGLNACGGQACLSDRACDSHCLLHCNVPTGTCNGWGQCECSGIEIE